VLFRSRLSIEEQYSSAGNYVRPMLRAGGSVRPISVAFLGGRLDMFRLNWWQMLFVMLIVRAKPGEYRNWEFIEQWATELGPKLGY
jgi:menaquinone-dependent protoporphyrinogen IX oxidase